MRVSAKVDYAVRAGAELAAAAGEGPVKGDAIAQAQGIPLKFLENILLDLKHAGLVAEPARRRGRLLARARPPAEISLADVIRAVEGPIANVRGERPEQVEYAGAAERAARGLDRRAREPARGARDGHARRRRRRRATRRRQADRGRPGRLAAALKTVSRLGRT